MSCNKVVDVLDCTNLEKCGMVFVKIESCIEPASPSVSPTASPIKEFPSGRMLDKPMNFWGVSDKITVSGTVEG